MNVLMKCIIATSLATSRSMLTRSTFEKSLPNAFCSSQPVLSIVTTAKKHSTKFTPPKKATLSDSLKKYRTEKAKQCNTYFSNVLGNKLISAIIRKRPDTLEKLQSISGMGEKRIIKYGMDIIQIILRHKKIQRKKTKENIKKKTPNLPVKTPRKPRPRPRPRPTQPRPYGPRCAHPTFQETMDCNMPDARATGNTGQSVYILELEEGRVYVGTSRDVDKRVSQHIQGSGAAFTRAFKPTGTRLPRLGNVSGDGDAAERDETLRYMYLRGMPFVRGWKYTQVDLSESDYKEAESNIRELFDLCRRCGGKGHFMSRCTCTRDRFGDLIE